MPIILRNVPSITDVEKMISCLKSLGKKINYIDKNTIQLIHQDIAELVIPEEARETRASIVLITPVLAHYQKVILPLPGGCAIGKRPINFHIDALKAFGVDVDEQINSLICTRGSNRLQANTIKFPGKTVTGTENAIMAAVLAEGTTFIQNAAVEPEIDDLINFLNLLGCKITGIGTETLKITGVDSLHETIDYSIMTDRIEAGTYLVAAAITGGHVRVKPINPQNLSAVLSALESMGAVIHRKQDSVTLSMNTDSRHTLNIVTQPFPGFPTDMQSMFLSLMTQLKGKSLIQETIFENRFQIVTELKKMGANIEVVDDKALVDGGTLLKAAAVNATDLRSGGALVCAALAANGTSTVFGIDFILRGYEDFVLKLKGLGAQIKLIKPVDATQHLRFFNSHNLQTSTTQDQSKNKTPVFK